jgi:Fe-S cluster assembly ATP-binding protein
MSSTKSSEVILQIQDLHVAVEDKQILKGLNLEVKAGEVHAIMGLNGSGKSTLANVLAGRDGYDVIQGKVLFDGEELLELDPEERAGKGLFLAFQYPVELPGVVGSYFLRSAYNAIRKFRGLEPLGVREFAAVMKEKLSLLKLDESFTKRAVNEGFSGGEKKRNEIFQLALLDPKLAILDETDSGLDIDALQIVADGVNKIKASDPKKAFVLITHYQRLLDYIVPDVVHVMIDGRIVMTGGRDLALKLEEQGYGWVKEQLGA